MQVDAAAAPRKGGEYRPSFADGLLLTFFRSKMEVSSISFLPAVKLYTMLRFDVLTSFRPIKE